MPLFAAVILALATTASLSAQVTGRLSGSVVDGAGSAIPGATVNLSLEGGSQAILTTVTNQDGVFSFVSVRPEFYDLSVEAQGFKKYVAKRVKVDPTRETTIQTIKLDIQTVQESVEVTGNIQAVEVASNAISFTLDRKQIDSLPVLSRQVSNLFQLQAGVGSSGRTNTNINGLRTTSTTMTLDGINVQENFIRTNPLDFIPQRFTIEQINEFTISSANNSSVVNGGAAQVNLVTRSGSNEFHGSAYWYNRNNAAAANTWFRNQRSVAQPFLNQNQFGGSVGGPVKKDKLLFYGNWEGFRLRQSALRTRTILTPEAAAGNFRYRVGSEVRSASLPSLRAFTIDPTMKALIDQLPKTGNTNAVGDGLNTTGYSYNQRSNTDREIALGKVDYNLSTRHVLSGTYNRTAERVDRGDVSATTFATIPAVANDLSHTLVSGSWRWTPAATLTNELRGGFFRSKGNFDVAEALPSFLVGGTIFTNPQNAFQPQGRQTNTYNIQDNANWIKGRHTVSFGYQGQFVRVASRDFAGSTPTYTLGLSAANTSGLRVADLPGISAADLTTANNLYTNLAGILNGYNATFNVTDRNSGFVAKAPQRRNYLNDNHAIYVQDQWKVRPHLTLTAGVRYEYYPPIDEKNGLVLAPVLGQNANYLNTIYQNHSLDFAGGSSGRRLYSPDRNNFAPNVGFAWDVFGNGRTSVRGGYSISFVNEEINAIFATLADNAGLTSTATENRLVANLRSVPSIPTPAYKVPLTIGDNFASFPGNNVGGIIDPRLRTPYVQQFSFSVQQEVKGTIIEARYIGNKQTKLWRTIDYNQVDVRQGGFLEDFIRARQNGFIAQAATGSFDPRYNPNLSGSQVLTVLPNLPGGGFLTNAAVIGPILTGEAGTLAQVYQTNGLNGNINFFPQPLALRYLGLTNYSNASYNGGQLEVRRRLRTGLQFQANYTFSKILSDSTGDGQTRFEEFLDTNNAKIERARSPFDIRHAFKANGIYELPFGTGKRFSGGKAFNAIAGNWSIGSIATWQTGAVYSILSGRGTLNRGARSGQNTANTALTREELNSSVTGFYMTPSGPMFINPSAINPRDGRGVSADGAAPFAGQAFFNPAPGGLGALQRRQFDGPGLFQLDLSVLKSVTIRERHTLQFRAEAINATNHPSFLVSTGADPNINATNFGRINNAGTVARILQFGMYYRF